MCSDVKELGRPEEIIKLLECPICQAVPMPPIWSCNSGHIACDQCRSQLDSCGLCRQPFSGGRNFFMEAVVNDCRVTCPYAESGCKIIMTGGNVKLHATECEFGPQIKWIACHNGDYPPNAVEGGKQSGVRLLVMRGKYRGSLTPGKLYEYAPPAGQGAEMNECRASLAWGGGQRFTHSFEVLVAPPNRVKWVPSANGDTTVQNAIPGGTSEDGERLFIGRFRCDNGDIVNGKIHPSHGCAYIGINGIEKASRQYEILVSIDRPTPTEDSSEAGNSSMFS